MNYLLKRLMNNMNIQELYIIRTLIFLETEPQSNEYHQVMLDQETFKKVTEVMSTLVKDGEVQEVNLDLSEETYKLPDLQDIYDNK